MKNAIIPVTVTVLALMVFWQLYLSASYHKEMRLNKKSVDSLITTNQNVNYRFDSLSIENRKTYQQLDRYKMSLFILRIVDTASAQAFDSIYYSDIVTNRLTIK